MFRITRREFLKISAIAGSGLIFSYKRLPQLNELEDFINDKMKTIPIPGLSACTVKKNRLIWSKGYGWANIKKKIPMSPDSVMNIGSVSKTFTATAIMQLWEKGKFLLDDDINDYLNFTVKNPRYPNETITFRQLLTHRSSIKDGSAYGESYSCGDPTITLETWLKEYFTPGGTFYNEEENFHTWKPGERGSIPTKPRSYSNVGFGLLGYLVEVISGMAFNDYTKTNIFQPLDMKETSWFLADLDISKHAVPYTYASEGKLRGELLQEEGLKEKTRLKEGFIPNCLYSFPNYPDGLVRTSVNQLARFLMAYINNGVYRDKRILKSDTIRTMLSNDHFGRGLCWVKSELDDGEIVWGHGGGDPGINTIMAFRPSDGVGIIVFANTAGARLSDISKRLFQEAADL